jgi:hypothetical protein
MEHPHFLDGCIHFAHRVAKCREARTVVLTFEAGFAQLTAMKNVPTMHRRWSLGASYWRAGVFRNNRGNPNIFVLTSPR